MPGQDPNFTYRKPDELTVQLVDQLRQTWNGLPADARDEIGGLLEQARAQLVKAAGDASADISTAIFQGGTVARRRAQPFPVWLRKLGGGSSRHQDQARLSPCAGEPRGGHDFQGCSTHDRGRNRRGLVTGPGRKCQPGIALDRTIFRSARDGREN